MAEPKKKPPSRNTGGDSSPTTPAPDTTPMDTIVDKVVDRLMPELATFTENLRRDVLADVGEKLKKVQAPMPDISGLAKLIGGTSGGDGASTSAPAGGGGLDLSAVSNLMTMANNVPVNYEKLTDKQIEAMKADRNHKLLLTLAPQILQALLQQQTTNPLMAEMMNRIFLDKVASSVMFDRAMMQKMIGDQAGLAKTIQQQHAQSAWLTDPITQANTAMQSRPPGGVEE